MKNINKYLYGPSEEEIEKRIENITPNNVGNIGGLLEKSAEYGYIKGIKKALELGAELDIHLDYCLCKAAMNGHLDVVKYLVEQGANIHAAGGVPLLNAVDRGHLDVVKYLVESGANLDTNFDVLEIASRYGHTDVVNYLKSKLEKYA